MKKFNINKEALRLEKSGVSLIRSTWGVPDGTIGKTESRRANGVVFSTIRAHLEHHQNFCERWGHGSYHHLEVEMILRAQAGEAK